VNSWTNPTFDGLLDLAQRDGVDIRPTLLRVITDGYMQNANPAPEEVRQYTELAIRLLEETDIAARAAVAERLAHHPAAPRTIIQQLARDVLEIAEPILRYSSCLTPADCQAIAKECSLYHAAIIAERGQPTAPTALTTEAAAPDARNSHAAKLCDIFFAADGAERRLILLNLDYAATEPCELPGLLQRVDIWRLELAALRHQSEVVMHELENTLGVSNRQAHRMVNDELGEPIVVAAKAMDMPADALQRMLLFLNPKVGQSVDRVYKLAGLYGEISVQAARRLITIFRDADTAERKSTRYAPTTWHHAVESARRALSEISHEPAAQIRPLRNRATG
jgi:hypothetical protein